MLLKNAWTVFQKGKSLANVEVWKNRTIAGGLVVAVLSASVAIAKTLGYDIGLDDEAINHIGYAIASVVGVLAAASTAATSEKVGLPTKTESGSGDAGYDPQRYE